jgi:hypothetical protein
VVWRLGREWGHSQTLELPSFIHSHSCIGTLLPHAPHLLLARRRDSPGMQLTTAFTLAFTFCSSPARHHEYCDVPVISPSLTMYTLCLIRHGSSLAAARRPRQEPASRSRDTEVAGFTLRKKRSHKRKTLDRKLGFVKFSSLGGTSR